MAQFIQDRSFSGKTELVCITLLQSEIDVALGFLRLAEVESHGGNSAHAAELIAKAILAHRTVLQDLGGVSTEFEEEKRELDREARKLLEAIRASERQFRIL
jgi:hypothetical protein